MFSRGITVQVRRYSTDQWGKRAVKAQFRVAGCAFAPQDVEEASEQGMTLATDAILYSPPNSGIGATDEVVIDGLAWDVAGSPKHWANPWTATTLGEEHFIRRSEDVP